MARGKLVLSSAALCALFVAYHYGAFDTFGSPEVLRQVLLAQGRVGFLVFVLAFGFLQPFGLPGLVFVIGASLVWPPPLAITLSLAGGTLATVNGFSFARYVARDWVEKRIPPRLRKYDDRLATHGFLTVFIFRTLFLTNGPIHALLGVSRVRFSTHLVASVLAYVIPFSVATYAGDALVTRIKHLPMERWIELFVAVCAIVSIGMSVNRWRLHRRGRVART